MWWIYALFSAFFAALTAILAKVGIRGIPSDLATAVRTVVILLIAWALVAARGQLGLLGSFSRQNWIFLVLSGGATGLSWLCYFRALQLGPVSKVAAVDKLSVALAIVFAVLFLGEAISLKTALGAGLIVGGTLVLIL